jgi:non-ribosomal peptide synthetase component F/malonyl CoA-acyl carrier protein transacylase/acyl carrier protein
MTIQELINNSFKRHEDNYALKSANRTLLYKNLHEQSDILAKNILSKGLKGKAIGVYLSDKIDFIISILGILKAQSIFVVIPNEFPVNRIRKSIETTDLTYVICSNTKNDKAIFNSVNQKVKCEIFSDLIKNEQSEQNINLDELAYDAEDIIYYYLQSTKDGLKAIAGKNKSLLNASNWFTEEFDLNQNTKSAFLSELQLEQSLFDIFPILISGGTINIPNNNIEIANNISAKDFTNKGEALSKEDYSKEYPFVLSNDKLENLEKQSKSLIAYLKNNSNANLADVSYSLSLLDTNSAYRRSSICSDVNDLIKKIEDYSNEPATPLKTEQNEDIVFLFAGLGSQYQNMGLGLYNSYDVFKNTVDKCCDIVNSISDIDIKNILYPIDNQIDKSIINSIDISQLVIFIFEYALAQLLLSIGIKPKVLIGYSFGEYIAAAVSEVFYLQDILKLIVLRGKLIKQLPEGSMLSVPMDISKVEPYLNDDVSLAINNGVSCIISGKVEAINLLQKELRKERILSYKLSGERAIHSYMMDDILDEFEKELSKFTLNEPKIPILSNLTGLYVKEGEMTDPQYWSRHLRNTVIFEQGIKELLKFEKGVFIEIGPGRDLCNLLSSFTSPDHKSFSLIRNETREVSDESFLLKNIENIWQSGVSVKWEQIFTPESRNKIEIFNKSEEIIDWLEGGNVNFLFASNRLLKELINMDKPESRLENLSKILVCEERINKTLLKEWFEKFDNSLELYTLYGYSETGIINSFHKFAKEDLNKPGIPIGKNIKGVRLIILDNSNQLCNEDQVGRVFIRTPYRSAGYLSKGEIKETCFIQNPYNENPKDLIFPTNNLGKLQSDGNVFILDKIDKRNISILNRPVHLKEIDAVIENFQEVEKSHTVFISNDNEDSKLYSFFNAKNEIQVNELEAFVRESLPAYMCAESYIQTNIDLSNEQDMDDNMLIELVKVSSEEEESFSETEKELARLWQEVLDVEESKIFRYSNFFELGGHSLKAISLISKIHEKFGVNLSLNDVFNNTSFSSQKHLIEVSKKETYLNIPNVEKKEYYPVSAAQKRLYFIQQVNLASTVYHTTTLLEVKGEVNKDKFESTFKKLIERHNSLRTSIHQIDNEIVQRIDSQVNFNIEYNDAQNTDMAMFIKSIIQPFNLQQAPLFRVNLIKKNPNDYILMIDMHHIITDATSRIVFVGDFMKLYNQEETGKIELQYNDFSEWQNKLFNSESIKKQEQFWLDQFKDTIPELKLKTDFERPPEMTFKGNQYSTQFDDALFEKINQLVTERNSTVNIFLLSVYYIFLWKFTGQTDIVVGSVIVGRRHSSLEKIIGFFVNMLPLYSKLSGEMTFNTYLNEVKELSLNAYNNQDYQFEELIKKLGIPRKKGRHTLVETVLTYRELSNDNNATTIFKKENLEFSYYDQEFDKAHFDLLFDIGRNRNSLFLNIEYSSDLFKDSTIVKFADHFTHIMEQVISNKNIKLDEITLSHDLMTASVVEEVEEDWDI